VALFQTGGKMLDEYTVFAGTFGNKQDISSSSLSELNKKLIAKLGNAAETISKDKKWRLITPKGNLVGIYIEEPNMEYQSPYHLLHQKINFAKVILGELKKEELENKQEKKIIVKGRIIVESYIKFWEDRLKQGINLPNKT
jgi:hypothetical protein